MSFHVVKEAIEKKRDFAIDITPESFNICVVERRTMCEAIVSNTFSIVHERGDIVELEPPICSLHICS